jgi:ATP-binding cassette subfamily B protein
VARHGAQHGATEADGKADAAMISVRAALGQILAYVGRYPGAALVVFSLIVVDVAFNTLLSLSPQLVIDYAIVPNNRRALIVIIVGLAAGFVAVAASQIWRDYLYAWLGACVLNDLRTDILEHLQILSLDFFARKKLGDLLARFSTDLGTVENAIVFGLPGFLYAFLHVAVSLSVLFVLEWRLAILVLVGLPLCLIGPRILVPSRSGPAIVSAPSRRRSPALSKSRSAPNA